MGTTKQNIKRVLVDITYLQYIPLDVLITFLHELDIIKTFEIVDTRSNMQLSDLNSKPRGGKSLRNIIYRAIGSHFYPPPVSVHYKLLFLKQFHGTTRINCEQKKNSEIQNTKISYARNRTTKPRASQI